MRNLLPVLLFILLAPSAAFAQYVGLSAFAARNPGFPCDRYLNIVLSARYPVMAVLWEGFGTDDTCILRFLAAVKDRPHAIQIHAWTNTAVESRTTEPGMTFYRLSIGQLNRRLEARDPVLIREMQLRVGEITRFVQAHGSVHTQCILSTGLEDNYSTTAFRTVYTVVREIWPYLINRNPLGHRSTAGMPVFLEKHGRKPKAAIVNEDGAVNSVKRSRQFLDHNKKSLLRLLWRPDHQGRTKSNRPSYPRAGREFGISAKDERELAALLSRY